jgi:hypothetical protein
LKVRDLLPLHHPQAVVLLFFAWNDMRDNFNHPPTYYNPNTLHRPYLAPGPVDPPVLIQSHPHWYEHLKLYEHFYWRAEYFIAKRLAIHWGTDALVTSRLPIEMPYGAPCMWVPFYTSDPRSARLRDGAWAATEQAFAALKVFLDRSHCRLIVIGIDNAFTVDPDVYDMWVKPLGVSFDKNAPLNRVGQILARQGIPYINAMPPLQALYKRSGQKVYNGGPGNISGHLTPEGQDVIARLAADQLASILAPGKHRQ